MLRRRLLLIIVALGAGACQAPPGADLVGYLIDPRAEPEPFGRTLRPTAPVEPNARMSSPAPFVERFVGPRGSVTNILPPIYSQARTLSERSFAFRPLVAARSTPERKEAVFLWPLGRYTREGEDKTLRIIPLVSFERRVRDLGDRRVREVDWFVLPFLFGGTDTEEGSYFAFFPFGGTLKTFLGKRRISFAAFPLWVTAKDKQYESFNVMWPLISYWRGPEQVGRRLLPLFMANHREGVFDRRFYLWPFYGRWEFGLNTRYPGTARFLFPLYGRISNSYITDSGEKRANLEWRTWLWPLFSTRWTAFRNTREMHAPWPFIGYERADGLVVRKLWPLWGVRKSNDLRHQFYFWPLYRRSVTKGEQYEHRWTNVGLLFSRQTERWVMDADGLTRPPPWPEEFSPIADPRVEAGAHAPNPTAEGEVRERSFTQLWPLFRHRRSEHDEVTFQALSLLPMRSDGLGETLYEPLYTLYRYERDASMQKREAFLFGFFRHFRRPEDPGPGMRYVNLAGLVNYSRRSGIGKEFSILGGLFGYERVGPRRRYRLLWIPLGRIPAEVRAEYEGG